MSFRVTTFGKEKAARCRAAFQVRKSAFEYKGKRSVLLLFDEHMRAEHPRFHGYALCADFFRHALIKRAGALGLFRIPEIGAVARPFSEFARKGKLRNEQYFAARVEYAAVHFVRVVAEDAQTHQFAREVVRRLFRVPLAYRQKHGETGGDFAYDFPSTERTERKVL